MNHKRDQTSYIRDAKPGIFQQIKQSSLLKAIGNAILERQNLGEKKVLFSR